MKRRSTSRSMQVHVPPRGSSPSFERVVALIVEHPGIGTPMSRGKRIHPFRVFKYSVVYRLVDSNPRILLVGIRVVEQGMEADVADVSASSHDGQLDQWGAEHVIGRSALTMRPPTRR